MLPAPVRRLLEACEAALEDTLLGRPHGVALPWRGTSKGRYTLDLYSGTGGVARAAVQQGCNARAYDRSHGPAEDLTDAKVLGRLGLSISRGEVLGAVMPPL